MTQRLQMVLMVFLMTATVFGQEALTPGAPDEHFGFYEPLEWILFEVDPSEPVAELAKGDETETWPEQVVELVNIERQNNGGLPPLKHNALLDNSSQTHSTNMAERDFFSHCDLDTGATLGDRIIAAGYTPNRGGENIAAGQTTPETVMTAWMNSTGHRANILNDSYHEIGVGFYLQSNDQATVRTDSNSDCVHEAVQGPYIRYWTQNFGRSSSNFPLIINREAIVTEIQNVALYIYGNGTFTEMRLRNNDGSFGEWQPFATEIDWQLASFSGLQTVTAELRRSNGSVVTSSDTITLNLPCISESFWFQQVEDWSGDGQPSVLTLVEMMGNFCPI